MAQPNDLLRRLVTEGGEIVSTANCPSVEVIHAEGQNRVAYGIADRGDPGILYRTRDEVRARLHREDDGA